MAEFLGLSAELVLDDRRDVEITLAGDSSGARLHVADVLFATAENDWLTEASLPRRPLARTYLHQIGGQSLPVAEPLPVLYGDGEPLVAGELQVRLGIDVFGAAFFLLSRYEELASVTRDSQDRFSAAGSLAYEERLLDRPLVNEYVELLWTLLSRLWPRLRRCRRKATLRLTHDVDLPLCRIPLSEARRLARRDLRREHAPLVALRRLATAALGGKVPPRHDLYNTFDLLMRESESLGVQSAFYFMACNTGGAIDGNYRLDDPWILHLLREISNRGHEIGLHPSYNTFRDPDAVRTEFQSLMAACAAAGVEQEELGGRQHYLRWANPITWQSWEDAGLAYDSTLGFADHAGFRAGTCYEYPVFNLASRRSLRLRERPLIVMDASLLEYQRMPLEAAADEIVRLNSVVKRFDGEMTVLWHNDRLLSRRARRAYHRAITGAARTPAGVVRR